MHLLFCHDASYIFVEYTFHCKKNFFQYFHKTRQITSHINLLYISRIKINYLAGITLILKQQTQLLFQDRDNNMYCETKGNCTVINSPYWQNSFFILWNIIKVYRVLTAQRETKRVVKTGVFCSASEGQFVTCRFIHERAHTIPLLMYLFYSLNLVSYYYQTGSCLLVSLFYVPVTY